MYAVSEMDSLASHRARVFDTRHLGGRKPAKISSNLAWQVIMEVVNFLRLGAQFRDALDIFIQTMAYPVPEVAEGYNMYGMSLKIAIPAPTSLRSKLHPQIYRVTTSQKELEVYKQSRIHSRIYASACSMSYMTQLGIDVLINLNVDETSRSSADVYNGIYNMYNSLLHEQLSPVLKRNAYADKAGHNLNAAPMLHIFADLAMGNVSERNTLCSKNTWQVYWDAWEPADLPLFTSDDKGITARLKKKQTDFELVDLCDEYYSENSSIHSSAAWQRELTDIGDDYSINSTDGIFHASDYVGEGWRINIKSQMGSVSPGLCYSRTMTNMRAFDYLNSKVTVIPKYKAVEPHAARAIATILRMCRTKLYVSHVDESTGKMSKSIMWCAPRSYACYSNTTFTGKCRFSGIKPRTQNARLASSVYQRILHMIDNDQQFTIIWDRYGASWQAIDNKYKITEPIFSCPSEYKVGHAARMLSQVYGQRGESAYKPLTEHNIMFQREPPAFKPKTLIDGVVSMIMPATGDEIQYDTQRKDIVIVRPSEQLDVPIQYPSQHDVTVQDHTETVDERPMITLDMVDRICAEGEHQSALQLSKRSDQEFEDAQQFSHTVGIGGRVVAKNDANRQREASSQSVRAKASQLIQKLYK